MYLPNAIVLTVLATAAVVVSFPDSPFVTRAVELDDGLIARDAGVDDDLLYAREADFEDDFLYSREAEADEDDLFARDARNGCHTQSASSSSTFANHTTVGYFSNAPHRVPPLQMGPLTRRSLLNNGGYNSLVVRAIVDKRKTLPIPARNKATD